MYSVDLRTRTHLASVHPHQTHHFIHSSQFHTPLSLDLYKMVDCTYEIAGAVHARHTSFYRRKAPYTPAKAHNESPLALKINKFIALYKMRMQMFQEIPLYLDKSDGDRPPLSP